MFGGTGWFLVRDAGALAGDDDDGHRIQTAGLVLPARAEERPAAQEGRLVPGTALWAGPTSLGRSGWRRKHSAENDLIFCRFRSSLEINWLGMAIRRNARQTKRQE